MFRFIYRILIIFFLSNLSWSSYAGGGWLKAKKKGYFKLSQWWVVGTQHYTDNGAIDPNITTGVFNSSLYGEYGISDKFNVIVYFPFFSRTYSNKIISGTTGEEIAPGSSLNSIGDTDLTLKYGIIRNKPVVLSTSLTLGLPFGKTGGGTFGTLQTGDGEFNQMLSFDLSTSFKLSKANGFTSVIVGFNNRTNGFSDEFRFGAEIGATLFDKFIGIMKLTGVKSLNNATVSDMNNVSIFSNNAEYVSIATELAYNISQKVGVSVYSGRAISGKLILADPSYSIGVYLNI